MRTTAVVPRIRTLFVKPSIRSAGTPNPISRITSNSGTPRKMSTYAVAIIRNGVSAAEREVRSRARIIAKMPIKIAAMIVSRMFTTKPLATAPRTSPPYDQSKNVSLTDCQPGEVIIRRISEPITITEESVAISAFLRPMALRDA